MLDQMERELFRETENVGASDPLFHYTDTDGLLGIIGTRQLWATHYRYLNDREELQAGEGIVAEEADRLASQFSEDTAIGFFVREFRRIHDSAKLSQIADIYVASLSENPNQLSQWRAYGANGNGYSVGFTKLRLPTGPRADAVAALALVKCEYDEAAFRDQARTVLSDVARGFELYVRTYARSHDSERAYRRAALSIAFRRLAIAPARFKNTAFSEEREWRMIVLPMRGQESKIVKYRSGRWGVTPFIPIDLADDGHLIDLSEIWIGPQHDPVDGQKSVQGFLQSAGYASDVPVKCSEIPYRG